MIFRVEKTSNYTVMSNYHLREKNMSLKAKGLLSWMLSNTDSWDYSIQGIVANCKENESAIKSTLKELQSFGYLQIKKLVPDKDTPRLRYEYVIYEKPQEGDFLALENQAVENPGQINTIASNTKEINNKNTLSKDKVGFDLKHSPKKTSKSNMYNDCVNEINLFTGNEAIRQELTNYLKMRIKLKGLTLKGWQGILKNFKERVAEKDYIAAIQYSISKEYRGIFNAPDETKKFTKQDDRPMYEREFIEHNRYDNEDHIKSDVTF